MPVLVKLRWPLDDVVNSQAGKVGFPSPKANKTCNYFHTKKNYKRIMRGQLMSQTVFRSFVIALVVLWSCGVGGAEEKEVTFCTDKIKDLTLKVDHPSYEMWLLFKGGILNVDEEYGTVEKSGVSLRKFGFPHEINAYVPADFSFVILENRNLKRIKLHPGACKTHQLDNLIDYDTKGPYNELQRLGDELPSDDPYLDPWDRLVDLVDEYGFIE